MEWCSNIHLPDVARSLWHPSRQREMKRGCSSQRRRTLSAESLGLSSSCVGTAFWMQTMWLQNVGQARKEACTVKLRLRWWVLLKNFLCREFRSWGVFKMVVSDSELSVKCQDKYSFLQLWAHFSYCLVYILYVVLAKVTTKINVVKNGKKHKQTITEVHVNHVFFGGCGGILLYPICMYSSFTCSCH